MKKSVSSAHRLISNTYGEAAINKRTCREWFERFVDGDFHVEDRQSSGRKKVYEDAALEELLYEDSGQSQEELAKSLGVTEQTVSKRLKRMGMVNKQGHWVPNELKPRYVERRLFACEQFLERQKRKGFLDRIMTAGKRWIHYDNPECKGTRRRYSSRASTSTARSNNDSSKVMLCIWWDQSGVIYYELLRPNETVTIDRYRAQLLRLSGALAEERPQYNKAEDKIILQYNSISTHNVKVIKKQLEILKWEVLPHLPGSPDITPSDYHLFKSMEKDMADQHFQSYEEIKNWIDSWITSKDSHFFRHGIEELPKRWEKVVANKGRYVES